MFCHCTPWWEHMEQKFKLGTQFHNDTNCFNVVFTLTGKHLRYPGLREWVELITPRDCRNRISTETGRVFTVWARSCRFYYRIIGRLSCKLFLEPVYDSEIVIICGRLCFFYLHNNYPHVMTHSTLHFTIMEPKRIALIPLTAINRARRFRSQ